MYLSVFGIVGIIEIIDILEGIVAERSRNMVLLEEVMQYCVYIINGLVCEDRQARDILFRVIIPG